jgi:hypothetical protein
LQIERRQSGRGVAKGSALSQRCLKNQTVQDAIAKQVDARATV